MSDLETRQGHIARRLEDLEAQAANACAARIRRTNDWTALFDVAIHAGMLNAYQQARRLVGRKR